MLLQIFLRNFYSNASCFSLVWLYLGNSQVSVDRTIGPTLVLVRFGLLSGHLFGNSCSLDWPYVFYKCILTTRICNFSYFLFLF